MALVQRSADSKNHPDGLVTAPHRAALKVANSVTVSAPTAAAIVTDADCWGTLLAASPTAAGPTVSLTAGTVTIAKAGIYRVAYGFSEISTVNSAVLTLEVYVGTTASGGQCKITQGATALTTKLAMQGETMLSLAIGDVVSIKVIASTGDFTATAGFFLVQEL